jgi:hypothetical protein
MSPAVRRGLRLLGAGLAAVGQAYVASVIGLFHGWQRGALSAVWFALMSILIHLVSTDGRERERERVHRGQP